MAAANVACTTPGRASAAVATAIEPPPLAWMDPYDAQSMIGSQSSAIAGTIQANRALGSVCSAAADSSEVLTDSLTHHSSGGFPRFTGTAQPTARVLVITVALGAYVAGRSRVAG